MGAMGYTVIVFRPFVGFTLVCLQLSFYWKILRKTVACRSDSVFFFLGSPLLGMSGGQQRAMMVKQVFDSIIETVVNLVVQA